MTSKVTLSASPPQDTVRAALSYFLVACIFGAICCVWVVLIKAHGEWGGQRLFWDARVYTTAIDTFRRGGDVYTESNALPFIYAPVFLPGASLLRTVFPGAVGTLMYLVTLFAATLAIPWLLARNYIQSQWLTPAIALLLFTFEPKFFGETMMLSGNISHLLYAAILIAGIPGLRRNRWLPFYLVLGLAALVKPALLALLLLPFLAGEGQLFWSAICAGVVALGSELQRFLMPKQYLAFQEAIYRQLVVRHDVGLGIFSYLLKIGNRIRALHGAGGWAMHLLVMGTLIFALWMLRRRRYDPVVAHLWVPCLLVTAILANPRMLGYDADLAIIPAIFICAECIRSAPAGRYRTAAVAGPLAIFGVVLGNAAGAAICLLLLASIVLVILRLQQARTIGSTEYTAGPAVLDPHAATAIVQ